MKTLIKKVLHHRLFPIISVSVGAFMLVALLVVQLTDIGAFIKADIISPSTQPASDQANYENDYPNKDGSDPYPPPNEMPSPGMPTCHIFSTEDKECEVCNDEMGNEISRECKPFQYAEDQKPEDYINNDPYSDYDPNHNSDTNPYEPTNDPNYNPYQNPNPPTTYTDAPNNQHYNNPEPNEYDNNNENQYNDMDYNKPPSEDIERQQREMRNKIDEFEREIQELTRFETEISRIITDSERQIKRMNRLAERITTQGGSTSLSEETIEWIEARIARAETIKSKLPLLRDQLTKDLSEPKNALETLNTMNASWDDLSGLWSMFSKAERFWIHKDALHVLTGYLHEENEISDWLYEVEKMKYELKQYGKSEDACVSEYMNIIDDLKSFAGGAKNDYENVIAELEKINSLTNPDDIRYAVDDARYLVEDMHFAIEDFRDLMNMEFRGNNGMYGSNYENQRNGAWECLEKSWNSAEDGRHMDKAKFEIENIKQILNGLGEILENVHSDSPKVKEALEKLGNLRTNAIPILENLSKKIESGEDMEALKPYFIKLEDLGIASEKYMNIIREWCKTNSSSCNLKPHHWDLLSQDFQNGQDDHHEEWSDEELINEFDAIIAKFEAKMESRINEIVATATQNIEEIVMKKIMEHIEGSSKDVMTNFVVNAHIYKDQAGAIAENSTAIYDALNNSNKDRLGSLASELSESVYTNSFKEDILAKINEISQAGNNEADQLIKELRSLMYENSIALAKEKIEFKDVRLKDNEWYFKYVVEAPANIIGGHPDGTYRPADTTNMCEAAKMFLEASGTGGASVSGGDWCEPYRAKARDLGLSIANTSDWGKAITRGEIATLIYEVGNFEPVAYAGEYPDISANDKLAEIAATLNFADIITGTGDGLFDQFAEVNRAQSATMVTRFLDAVKNEQAVEDWENMKI